jgi:hypothetical protein
LGKNNRDGVGDSCDNSGGGNWCYVSVNACRKAGFDVTVSKSKAFGGFGHVGWSYEVCSSRARVFLPSMFFIRDLGNKMTKYSII